MKLQGQKQNNRDDYLEIEFLSFRQFLCPIQCHLHFYCSRVIDARNEDKNE